MLYELNLIKIISQQKFPPQVWTNASSGFYLSAVGNLKKERKQLASITPYNRKDIEDNHQTNNNDKT